MRAPFARACLTSLVLATWACASCTPSPTQLVVVVDTDLAIPSALDEVSITVSSETGVMESETQRLSSRAMLPLTLGVVTDGDFLGPIEVVARGMLYDGFVLERAGRVTLVRGETRVLRLHLVASCVGVSCGRDESCGENGCDDIDLAELPPWSGTPPRLGEDAGALRDAGLDARAATTDAPVPDAPGLDVGPNDAYVAPVDAAEPFDAFRGCTTTADCLPESLGPWSDCNFADSCVETGTRTRTRRTFECRANVCFADDTIVSDACMRESDGSPCGMSSCDAYGPCDYTDGCDESATQSRACVDLRCSAGVCGTVPRTETTGCDRETDGMGCGATSCGSYGACDYTDVCDESALQRRTCTDRRCASGSCGSVAREETDGCSRTTGGMSCGLGMSCGGGSCSVCTRTATGSFGVDSNGIVEITGAGGSLNLRNNASPVGSGSVGVVGATFSGGATSSICIWGVEGLGNRIRLHEWGGGTTWDLPVSGATVTGGAMPPCIDYPPYGCFTPCLTRISAVGSRLDLVYSGVVEGSLSFSCP